MHRINWQTNTVGMYTLAGKREIQNFRAVHNMILYHKITWPSNTRVTVNIFICSKALDCFLCAAKRRILLSKVWVGQVWSLPQQFSAQCTQTSYAQAMHKTDVSRRSFLYGCCTVGHLATIFLSYNPLLVSAYKLIRAAYHCHLYNMLTFHIKRLT